MNIFETAMKMEEDGRAYYLENAEKTVLPELKKVLLELADDELKHFNLFKAMRDRQPAEYQESQATTILATVKNVFEQMKADGKEIPAEALSKTIWETAREVEKQAEAFYREKAAEVSDEDHKKILNRIADEEHRHWVTMENVVQFLDQPSQWLENAEWKSLEG